MPSFSIPLSGLQAESTALNTIANNLANMNTTAYKAQSVNFGDLFYQQIGSSGSGNPVQVGTGSQVSSISTNFTTGSPTSTGNASDVALQGDGFFVVKSANGNATQYTRNGTFGLTSTGGLVTQSGLQVMGYPANSGVVDTTAALVPLIIPKGQVQQPQATANISVTGNLNALGGTATTSVGSSGSLSTAAGATDFSESITVVDSAGVAQSGTIAYTAPSSAGGVWNYTVTVGGKSQSGTLTPDSNGTSFTDSNAGATLSFTGLADGGSASFSLNSTGLSQLSTSPTSDVTGIADGSSPSPTENLTVYDSLGVSHVATITFTKDSSAPGTWSYSIAIPGATASSTNAAGKLSFDSKGNLAAGTPNITGIAFSGLADGAAPISFDWKLMNANGTSTISQTASASSFSASSQDGYASGVYSSFTINSDGVVEATFDNGQTSAVGQIAVAMVTNEQGLNKLGSGNYETTLASGQASVGVAGTGGRGSMEGSYVEASNVDISTEFSNLIVAQRAFEANSKAVTTFDTVSQETINMIR
jgi:flagellar hook protein FlgE